MFETDPALLTPVAGAVLLALAAKANELCRKLPGADVAQVRISYGEARIRLERAK